MTCRTKVLVPGSSPAGPSDLNFLKLARFQGIHAEFMPINDDTVSCEGNGTPGQGGPFCLAASAGTLLYLARNPDLAAKAEKWLFGEPVHLLVYGFAPSEGHDRLLTWLTSGRIDAVREVDTHGAQYEITSTCPSVCRQMSGLSFGPILPGNDFVFLRGSGEASGLDLITIRNKPFVISLNRGSCRMFLVAGKAVADIDAEFDPSQPLERLFSRLAPFMLFLRDVFQEMCWHAPKSFAALTIDDPLLKNKYGWLDYTRLLQEMDQHGFFSNIAFIPVNYRRSRKETVELFLRRPDRYALCVHGCEHTRAEFGETHPDILEEKVDLATMWMNRHTALTNLPFDKIMVFPQGIFSCEAMRVLHRQRYLAAVNTEPRPQSFEGGLRLSDFLRPAVTAYGGFPLFLRRYPGNLPGFAFDLFLGKPALIVVHQDYFRDGYGGLGDFVRRINSLDPHLCWDRLARIVAGSYLVRRDLGNNFDIRAYAHSVAFENPTSSPYVYRISKAEPEEGIVDHVEFSGTPVPYQLSSGQIFVTIELGPRASGTLEIVHGNRRGQEPRPPSLWHSARVQARRGLSEIRDELLSRNRAARKYVSKITRLLNRH